ncbi:unnamed protein product [Staurois parvus]|uniref:Uncharacterized protein n=1 Tax=Staurois parvus TaxID=386267 RepID=A0ABN9AC55_9NEOB|nr:unnamed protein product [Staurois parvus]
MSCQSARGLMYARIGSLIEKPMKGHYWLLSLTQFMQMTY